MKTIKVGFSCYVSGWPYNLIGEEWVDNVNIQIISPVNEFDAPKFSIYPNPATAFSKIENANNTYCNIQI